MQDNLSGLMTQQIEVNSKESSGINKPEYLKVLADFSDWMREQPETDNVNILSDILRRLNKNMHGDDPSYYRLPDDQELSAQYLLLYELSLPYGLDLNNQIDVDKAATRIVVTTKNLTSTQNIELEQRSLSSCADVRVTDRRREVLSGEQSADYLGVIRGGFGNPLAFTLRRNRRFHRFLTDCELPPL